MGGRNGRKRLVYEHRDDDRSENSTLVPFSLEKKSKNN